VKIVDERKPEILIVEDDEDLARLNARFLENRKYDVRIAHTAAKARLLLHENTPDLIILDVVLPDGDGFALCEEFRRGTDVPVLFMTGRTETQSKVIGLEAGGDYYLTKPFDSDEFLAVVNSLIRRMELNRKKIDEIAHIERGSLSLRIPEKKAFVNGRNAELTRKEFEVLLILVQNEETELSSETIYETVWGANMNIDTGLVRKHISTIKKKLGEEEAPDFNIFTEYGRGYTFTTK
jgi:DNA-binding response OmpR family regulator